MLESCELCRGLGLVSCYSPWIVSGIKTGLPKITACGITKTIRDAEGRIKWDQPTDIPCTCDAGNPFLKVYKKQGDEWKPMLWNDRHEEQARYGEKWWHIKRLPQSPSNTEEVQVNYILEAIADFNNRDPTRNPFNDELHNKDVGEV